MRQLLKNFLQVESSSSILLFLITIIAMLWANSFFSASYHVFETRAIFITNEGLMAIFFLLVGLELKRGYVEGELAHFSQIILPGFAAIGGMIVPAIIYILFNLTHPTGLRGWATPVATDIAFAVGVLSFFGKRVPVGLKIFLLALAIFDDVGAILIIVLFYSHGLSLLYLLLSLLLLVVVSLMNFRDIRSMTAYLLIGACLWWTILKAGIHPTIAGVILAFLIPHDRIYAKSMMHRMEKLLQPWVAFGIMPLFALVNAGVTLHDLSSDMLVSSVVLGIALGLFIGKQIGVFSFTWVLVKLKYAKLPANTNWLQLYGTAIICGIGFTMSLFLGTLSFQNESVYLAQIRMGVLAGSILSGVVGAIVLWVAFRATKDHRSIVIV